MTAPGVHGTPARAASFGALSGLAYLDTATKGVPPADAVTRLHEEIARWASGTADTPDWEAAGESARADAARLLGRNARDVALVPNQVTAASVIAHGLPDAAVVVPEVEYRSNLLPWLAGRDRVRLVPAPATTERLCAAVDAGTDIVAVSSVQSADGWRVDLPALVRHAHERGALVYVDASQSLGVDGTLAACGADFVGAVAYKFLLGMRGTGFLAIRPEHRGRLEPLLPSPQSLRDVADDVWYGPGTDLWPDARRFDQPPAWLAWVATAAAMRELAQWEATDLDAHASRLARRFATAAGARPGELPSPIVSVPCADAAAAEAVLRAHGVRAAARSGGLRFAFHLYNTEADVDQALAGLRAAGVKE